MLLKNNDAKFAFLYLFSLVALLFMSLGTGQVFFQAINKFVPDFAAPYANGYDPNLLKFAISSLIIAIPLYFLTMRFLERALIKGALDKDSAIRRWLTYFILFVSAIVMVIWLIITIGNFLDGELTTKFILKAITAVVISAIIFSYYLYDIRREAVKAKNKIILTYLIGALVITIGSLIFSFFFVESPVEARARRHDTIVLDHFTQIDSALNTYFTKKNNLPDSLAALAEEVTYINVTLLKDPQSGADYEYKKIDTETYQLCANFQTDNRNAQNQAMYVYSDRWPHQAGYQCLKQKTLDYGQGSEAKPMSAPMR